MHLCQNPTGGNPIKLDPWTTYHPSESKNVSWRNFNTVAMRALPHAVNHYVNDTQVSHCSPGAKTINGTFYWLGDVVAGREMPFKLDWVRGWAKAYPATGSSPAAAGPR